MGTMKFSKEGYQKLVLARFKKNFSYEGLVFMKQIRSQIEDGTISGSKLTKEEYLAIWNEAHADYERKQDDKAKKKLNERNKRKNETGSTH